MVKVIGYGIVGLYALLFVALMIHMTRTSLQGFRLANDSSAVRYEVVKSVVSGERTNDGQGLTISLGSEDRKPLAFTVAALDTKQLAPAGMFTAGREMACANVGGNWAPLFQISRHRFNVAWGICLLLAAMHFAAYLALSNLGFKTESWDPADDLRERRFLGMKVKYERSQGFARGPISHATWRCYILFLPMIVGMISAAVGLAFIPPGIWFSTRAVWSYALLNLFCLLMGPISIVALASPKA